MTRIFTTLILSLGIFAASASPLTDQADQAYAQEKYNDAIDLYRQAANEEGTSSDLYYNLGNAYYQSGNASQAILAYERALRLDPTNSEARTNLEFVNERIVDKKGETGSFLYNTYIDIVNKAHSNTWAITALIFFIIAIAGAVAYFFVESILIRKLGFFGGIFALIVSIVAVVFSFKAKSIAEDRSQAIITAETTVLSTVPRAPISRNEEAMLLHEGTKVRILRSMNITADSIPQTWHEVEIDNRHRAWIDGNDIEHIVAD